MGGHGTCELSEEGWLIFITENGLRLRDVALESQSRELETLSLLCRLHGFFGHGCRHWLWLGGNGGL